MSDNQEDESTENLSDWVNTANIILRNYQMMMDKIDAHHIKFLELFGQKDTEREK